MYGGDGIAGMDGIWFRGSTSNMSARLTIDPTCRKKVNFSSKVLSESGNLGHNAISYMQKMLYLKKTNPFL